MSKTDFLNLALQNIGNHCSIYTSISFLQSLIMIYPRESQSGRNYSAYSNNNNEQAGESRERIVHQLMEHDIFSKLIAGVSNYMQKVATVRVTDEEIAAANGIENVAMFGDKISHKDYIDCMTGCIEFLITNSKSANLSFNNIRNLFKSLVSQSITEYEQKVFFNFLTKENDTAVTRERKYLLDERSRTDVFQKIMCNEEQLDCSRLGMEGFRCFKMLFLNVNAEHRNINYNVKTGHFEIPDMSIFSKLHGFETLWTICIENRDEKVATESRNFLVDLYIKAIVNQEQKKVFCEGFLEKID